jgi:hypothetical protein
VFSIRVGSVSGGLRSPVAHASDSEMTSGQGGIVPLNTGVGIDPTDTRT